MTRALARLEHAVDSSERDWNLLHDREQKTGADGTNGLALGERIQVMAYESVDGDSESSKKTLLGSMANAMGRSRLFVEALQQQWPDHELMVYDGERKRANESRDAW